jgi:5-methylcytosine-specific restriction endonuclease McrA
MNDHEYEQAVREIWESLNTDDRCQIIEWQMEYKRNERKKKYLAYLDSDQWMLIRRLKLEEARGKCEVCSSDKLLQVHHRDYSRLFNERLEDLTVLCDRCHELYETNKRMQKLSA